MIRRLLGAAALLLSADLAPIRATSPTVAPAAADPHSFSRPAEIAVRHLELDLAVDFAERRLTGSATLTLERRDPAAMTLHLDTRSTCSLVVGKRCMSPSAPKS